MKASRVIRDKITKVGKGTGLLQFESPECVKEALKLDGETWRDSKLHVVKSKFAVHSSICFISSGNKQQQRQVS